MNSNVKGQLSIAKEQTDYNPSKEQPLVVGVFFQVAHSCLLLVSNPFAHDIIESMSIKCTGALTTQTIAISKLI